MPAITMLIKPASSLCNMRCKYCFYADVANIRDVRSYGMMTEETQEMMVQKAFAYATGSVTFAFQGGEPTLAGLPYFRRLMELEQRYNTNHIHVQNSIQTNGYIIDEEWAKFFADNHFLVGLSIDGTREAHDTLRVDAQGKGTYDVVRRSAALLTKYGAEFNVLCVVNNLVARHPQKVYQQLKKYKYMQFIPCLDGFDGEKSPYSLTPERYGAFLTATFDLYYQDFMNGQYTSVRNFDNYINILLGYPPENCAMNGFCSCYYVIEGDGSVYPCDFYVLDEWCLGNVKTHELGEMMSSETAKRFVGVSKYVMPECRACRYFPICRGGCRRDREPFVDGHPGLNRLCKSYQMFFDASIVKMEQIAQRL